MAMELQAFARYMVAEYSLTQGAVMTDCVVNHHFLDVGKAYEYHYSRAHEYQKKYAQFLSSETGLRGRVLDVGCGHGENPTYQAIAHLLGQLDGVDPFPVITPPHHLANRWTCRLEDIPVPANTYDMAYSYWVVEHVADVPGFLSKIVEILKPGGVYWSLSPNNRHPFPRVSRLIEILGLKRSMKKNVCPEANDYPAYYRICSDKAVLKCVKDLHLPVAALDFYYVPDVRWDHYFPRILRFIPYLLDRFITLKDPTRSFVLMFRLEKAAT